MSLDNTATLEVKAGDIGCWPNGSALAIFFGTTPISTSDDSVPASEVNLVGWLNEDATVLRSAKIAERILVDKIST